jgi:tetratricopeptide (TPR) repeat protein
MSVADDHCDRAVELAQAGDLDGALAAARAGLGAELGFARALDLIDALEAMIGSRTHGGATAAGGASPWRIGAIVDQRFEVRGLLGRGGMGAVYRVHHREWGIDLAVKTPLPEILADDRARTRFLREAHCWIDLGVHPHLVQCWFVREIEGLPRLFLELVEGGTVDELAARGHFRDPLAIVDAMIQVCDGLEHVHGQNIVHRDLKPSNLLVGEAGRIQLTDLGIARAHGAIDARGGGIAGGLATSGSLLGTPSYGAPEQWRDAASVDGRADLYALGVIGFELCAGRRPFDNGDANAQELIARHLREPPPPLARLAAHVPGSLVEIVEMLLAKDPTQRFATARATRAALASVSEELGRAPRSRPEIHGARGATLNNRGISRWDLGDRVGARAGWNEAIAHDPRQAEALYNLATVAWRAGEIDDLEAHSRITAAGEDPRGLVAQGYLALERGAFAEAERLLARAVGDPEIGRESLVWLGLGDARLALGGRAAAIEAYGRAHRSDPEIAARLAAAHDPSAQLPVRATTTTSLTIGKPWGTQAHVELVGASRVIARIARRDERHRPSPARAIVWETAGTPYELWAADTEGCWLSPDATRAAALDGARLFVTDFGTGRRYLGEATCAAWIDDRRLITCDPHGRIAIVDVTTERADQPWHLGTPVTHLLASAVHDRIVFATAKELVTCAIAQPRIVARVPFPEVKLERIANDRAIGRTETALVVIDLAAGWAHEIRLAKTMYAGPVIDPTGSVALVEIHGNAAACVLVDLRVGRAIGMLGRGSGDWRMAVSPTGTRVALQSADGLSNRGGALRIWDVATRRVVHEVPEENQRSWAFWPEDHHVLSSASDLALHELATGKRTQLAKHRGRILQVAGERALLVDTQYDRDTIEVADVRLGTVPTWRTLLASRGATVLQQVDRSRDVGAQIASARSALARGDAGGALAAIDEARRVPSHERDAEALALQASLARMIPAKRLRDAWPVRALPYRLSRVVMTPDGVLAGSTTGPGPASTEILVTTIDGRELQTITGPTASLAMSADGRWLAGLDANLVIWELATGREVYRRDFTRDAQTRDLFARFECGDFDGKDFVDRDPPAWGARPDGQRVFACTDRYYVTGRENLTMHDVVLWDRERQRAVWRQTLPDRNRMATVTLGGRFLLAAHQRELQVFDLATGELHRTIDTRYFDYDLDVLATPDGRHVVLAGFDACWLFELDWELDPGGDPDPLGAAWNTCDRPPVVAAMRELIALSSSYDHERIGAERIAFGHPDLELAMAPNLIGPKRIEWTRRALTDRVVAANPDAWAQLARFALDAGDHDLAADAAAEGLARSSDHAELGSLLERARAHGRLPELSSKRSFRAAPGPIAALAADGDAVVLCDDRHVYTCDLARGTSAILVENASGSCLAANERWIAIGRSDGDIVVWDREARRTGRLATRGWMSPGDRNQLAFGMAYGAAAEDIERAIAEAPKQPIRAVAFDARGHLVTIGDDWTLRWWDLAKASCVREIEEPGYLRALAVRTDDVIVAGERDLVRHVLGASTRTVIDSAEATALAWSPASGLVAGSSRGVLRWEDGRAIDGHLQAITQLAVAGERLASVSADGLQLWRARTRIGSVMRVPRALVAIGDTIVSADETGTITIW